MTLPTASHYNDRFCSRQSNSFIHYVIVSIPYSVCMKSDAIILNLKCSYKLKLLITSSYVCPRVVRSSQALGTSCEIFHIQANMVSPRRGSKIYAMGRPPTLLFTSNETKFSHDTGASSFFFMGDIWDCFFYV